MTTACAQDLAIAHERARGGDDSGGPRAGRRDLEDPSAVRDEQAARVLEGTRFEARARIAAGGMGEIYDAVDCGSSERVVVKVLRERFLALPEMLDRMRVEGEALTLLDHPNIVAARGYGRTARGRPYVAMEHVPGVTLQQLLRRRGALPPAEAIDLAGQLLSALEAVHRAGVVHRDVKPENAMVYVSERGRLRLKLLDFGVAKIDDGPGGAIAPLAFPTLEGACVGTPRYAAPEQASGAPVDPRTDLYAAGIVLYGLVAGRGPFDEIKGTGAILRAHAREPPPPPSRFAGWALPAGLEPLILRAIAKRPEERFADAGTFRRALVEVMSKLCLPIDLAPRQPEIAAALARSGLRRAAAGVEVRRGPCVARGARSALAASARRASPRSAPWLSAHARAKISGAEVLLSLAAFVAAGGGLAMWLR